MVVLLLKLGLLLFGAAVGLMGLVSDLVGFFGGDPGRRVFPWRMSWRDTALGLLLAGVGMLL